MYCLNMLRIALELALTNPAYEDIATKFFEHFIYIADALTHLGGEAIGLWHPEDGFFYDVLHMPDDRIVPLQLRSFVGLDPPLCSGDHRTGSCSKNFRASSGGWRGLSSTAPNWCAMWLH